MTTKDYIKLADTFVTLYNQNKNFNNTPSQEAVRVFIIKDMFRAFCDTLKMDNYKFDEDKFESYITKRISE